LQKKGMTAAAKSELNRASELDPEYR